MLKISPPSSPSRFPSLFFLSRSINRNKPSTLPRNSRYIVPITATINSIPLKPDPEAQSPPCLSDILWPSAGAFAAMAIMGRLDQIIAPKGLSMTIAPFGAVCAVLFATPTSPSAKKYNVFMAQIGCSAIGVLALSVLGPGWIARSTALAASIAFMIYTRSTHPPAASLPILFIDGPKFHHLQLWYALFPGAIGCILLCLIVFTQLQALEKKQKVTREETEGFHAASSAREETKETKGTKGETSLATTKFSQIITDLPKFEILALHFWFGENPY